MNSKKQQTHNNDKDNDNDNDHLAGNFVPITGYDPWVVRELEVSESLYRS